MTNVEEWTNAEMGVGADIAAGSQGENGKIADLVQAPRTIIRGKIPEEGDKENSYKKGEV